MAASVLAEGASMSWKLSQARIGLGAARSAIAGAGAVACILALGACSSASSSGTAAATGPASATGSTTASATAAAAGSCGTVPQVAPIDPQHVIADLPASDTPAYNLYQSRVLPSAWAHWKPGHAGPYKVAIL